MSKLLPIFLFLVVLSFAPLANATYRDRLSLSAGLMHLKTPKQTNFEFGLEAEHRLHRWIGVGAMGNYVLANPGITIIGAPEFFLHPFNGNWFFSSAPIFQIRKRESTAIGLRLGTRILIPFPALRIAPSFDYDFIHGGHQYLFALGVEMHTP